VVGGESDAWATVMSEEENGKGNKERKSMKNRGQGFNSIGVLACKLATHVTCKLLMSHRTRL
jgi:hypothetical protein